MSRILVADDERSICQAFAQMLRLEGHEPVIAASGREALQLLGQVRPDAVFLDVRMPGMDGLSVLEQIRRSDPDLPVIVMTAYGTVQTALEAVRLGAFDYLGKPLELAQVRELLRRALHRPVPAAGLAETAEPPEGEDADPDVPMLIGRGPAMQELFKQMVLVTGNDLTVLVLGESGSGKELVARGIHHHGQRASGPFVAVNCAAIPENLLESELFGHEKGAFTGAMERRIGRMEAAQGGTLFLDEIGELPLALQSKLLRVLQERCFERVGSNRPQPLEARVIAAANRDLQTEAAEGRFRADLYHRLNLVTLRVPPLRERPEDVALLAAHFLRQANRELGRALTGIEDAALQRLRAYTWPGNVRELEHLIKRSALTARGKTLTVHDIALPEAAVTADPEPACTPTTDLDAAARLALARALEDPAAPPSQGWFHHLTGLVERALIAEALRITGDNQVAASRLLGLHRTTLRKKMVPPSD